MPTLKNTIFTHHANRRLKQRGFSKRIVVARLAAAISGNVKPLHGSEYRLGAWRIVARRSGERFIIITAYQDPNWKNVN